MAEPRKCRICSRVMRPRTSHRPSHADPTVCQVCVDLMWALHHQRPTPRKEVAA